MTGYPYDHSPVPVVHDNGLASCDRCGRALTRVAVTRGAWTRSHYRHLQRRRSTSYTRRRKST